MHVMLLTVALLVLSDLYSNFQSQTYTHIDGFLFLLPETTSAVYMKHLVSDCMYRYCLVCTCRVLPCRQQDAFAGFRTSGVQVPEPSK